MRSPAAAGPDRPRVLLVIQPSVSHYREALVRNLLAEPSLEFVLLGKYQNAAMTGAANSVVDAREEVIKQVYRVSEVQLRGAFKWQRGVLSKTLRERADIYVYEGSPYNLSTWPSILVARLKGGKPVLWGHGWKRPDGALKLLARKFFYRIVSGHLVYGDWAKSYANEVGLQSSRFYPVYNSIYSESVIVESATSAKSAPSLAVGGGTLSLIFSGRLTPRHDVSLAVSAITRLIDAGLNVRFVVVGEGSELDRLKEKAEGYPEIEFVGGVYDVEILRRLYQDAHYALSAGASGLNVIQSLSFGVPVIAADGHYDSGPEIEAVQDAETGFLFEAGSEDDLVSTLHAAVAVRPEVYSDLVKSARTLVMRKYTAEQHASAIVKSVKHIATRGRIS